MICRPAWIFVMLLIVTYTNQLHAQTGPHTIYGKILSKSGLSLNNSSLKLQPAGDTATTDQDGKFTIKAKAGDSLLIENPALTHAAVIALPAYDSVLVTFGEGKLNVGQWKSSSGGLKDSISSGTEKSVVTDTVPRQTDTASQGQAVVAAKGDSVFVKGKIVDASGQPVVGASITYPDGKLYTADENGTFSIPFIQGQQVTVSSVGLAGVNITLTDPNKPLKVELTGKKSSEELEQVTVTALGISKKGRSVGYSVQEVSGAAVQTAKETNFVNALQGKLSGVQINGNTGSMGGSAKVLIRGNKSITGNNNALFVVDGVFMGNTNNTASYNQQIGGGGYDYGSPIQDLNPDDIDQISVLKGAAATALYGSRGGNGVVVITTKKANRGKFGVNYSLNAQMDRVYVLPKFQNEYGGGSVDPNSKTAVGNFTQLIDTGINKQYFLNAPTYHDDANNWGYDLMPSYSIDESWGPKLDGKIYRPYYSFDKDKNNPFFGVTSRWSPQPNNVKDYYRTGVTVTNSISMGGKNDRGSFRLSYANMSQKFILPNSNMYRNNIGFNGNYKLADKVTAIVGANYSENRAIGRPGTGFSGANPTELFTMYSQRQLELDKLKYYEFPDGSQVSWNRKAYNDPQPASATTPYWMAYKAYETDSRKRLYGTAGLEIRPTDWLNISAKAFMDQYSTLVEERSPKDYQAGGYTRTNLDHTEMNYQLMGTAKKAIGDFDLTVTAGGNIMKQRDQMNSSTANGLITPGLYTLTNTASVVKPVISDIHKQINSLFGDVTLGYKNSVFLDVTGRNDWASSLYPRNPSFFYPSASLSAIFSDWLKWDWLSFGKVRGSVARIGYDTDPYRTIQAYALSNIFNGLSISSKDLALANPDLRPEMSTEFEGGVELKFLKNRVGLDATVYSRKTKDLIIPLQISPTTGYNTLFANVGTSRTKGFELTLSGTPVLSENFKWDAALNLSLNRSKLIALNIPNNPDANSQPVIIGTDRRSGNPVSVAAMVGQPLYVLIGTDYTYKNGQKVVDTTQGSFNYVANPNQVLGNTQPDYVGGFSNTFTYKNFSLSALLDFQHGGSFYSYTNTYGLASGTLAETVANNIRENGVPVSGVLADGTSVNQNVRADLYFKNTNNGRIINKAAVYDASYVYLREVKLGFALPERWFSRIKASNASVSLYGRNLWLIHSNAPNVDPSNILNSDSNIMGLEGGALPSLRSYGINLNLGF